MPAFIFGEEITRDELATIAGRQEAPGVETVIPIALCMK